MKKITFDARKMIRPTCANFLPYIAGKPVETIKRELGLKSVIKLASNENPLGPSKKALVVLRRALPKIYFYPDSNSFLLRRAVAKKFRMDPATVMLGCGSDEIIELLAKVFFHPEDEIVISQYAFLRYQMAGDLMNCRISAVPMKNYTHDLAAMAQAVTKQTKAVFITNPNNPTGTYNTAAEVKAFLAAVAKKRPDNPPLVILDEAYYEYARVQKDYPDSLSYLPQYPNVVVLRTFSKVYGLAGLRVGYGFASKDVVDYVERTRPPFNVNSLAQAAAVASLADPAQVTKSVKLVEGQKKYLYRALEEMGVPYVPTAANFILMEARPLTGRETFQKLLREGVIVRAMDEYSLPYHIRVTIGTPEENRRFIRALRAVRTKTENTRRTDI